MTARSRGRPSLLAQEVLWVWGLGLLLLAPVELANLLADQHTKRLDTLAWIVVGMGLPLVSALVAGRLASRPVLARGLGAAALLLMATYIGSLVFTSWHNLTGLLFGGIECWLFFWVLRRGASQQVEPMHGRLVFGLIVLFTWATTLGLVFWSEPDQWLLGNPWAIVVTVGTAILVFTAFWVDPQPRLARAFLHRGLLGVTVVLLVIGSFYPVDLGVYGVYHHWSFYIGPAELVRAGGVLLWNVPSQYGFLSILVLGWMPVASLTGALYLACGVADLAMALSFIGMGWLALRTFGQRATVCLLVICGMFLRSGFGDAYVGPSSFPSIGGYRFAWTALEMLVLLAGNYRYGVRAFPRWLLWLASAIWVASVLWSAESMLYTSTVFVPGFAFIVATQEGRAPLRWLRRALVPAGLLFAAIAIVVGGYIVGLGHPPDLSLYVEYLLVYNGGLNFLPVAFEGPAWILFIVAVLVSASMLAARRIPLPPSETFRLMVPALGAFATASYFMAARSHPNNITNVSLFLCLPLLLVCAVAEKQMRFGYLHDLSRLVVPVVLFVLIAMPLADATALQAYLSPPGLPPGRTIVQPVIDPSLQALINRAGLVPYERIILQTPLTTVMPPWISPADGSLVTESLPWLPVAPLDQIDALPAADRDMFMERYGETHHEGGWLIVERGMNVPAWLIEYIDTHYVAVETFDDPGWTATRYARLT